ncbi:MAG: hypothetical protein E7298_09155 [Lachnospiraceae bacterium]|nr:hypothetical protein [Lachnospiraceae bacterium]
MQNITTFYLIYDHLLGKKESGEYFLFENGQWIMDTESIIRDHLAGYDPSEPADSPYAIGCTDIMDEIREISQDEAKELMEEKA